MHENTGDLYADIILTDEGLTLTESRLGENRWGMGGTAGAQYRPGGAPYPILTWR